MAHANAALTPIARLKLARLIVEHGWSVSQAAVRFQVSWPTAKRWSSRYEREGEAGVADRSSRPHSMPRRTPRPMVRKVVHLVRASHSVEPPPSDPSRRNAAS